MYYILVPQPASRQPITGFRLIIEGFQGNLSLLVSHMTSHDQLVTTYMYKKVTFA